MRRLVCTYALLRCGQALLLLLVAGCDRPESEGSEALAIAEPHLEAFERHAAWAERALRSHAQSAPGALGEVLFSPLRLESDVLDAVVVVVAEPAARYKLRARGSQPLAAARQAEVHRGEHAGLRAARSRCEPRRDAENAGSVPCVWLSREWPAAGAQPGWSLSVAYAASAASTASSGGRGGPGD